VGEAKGLKRLPLSFVDVERGLIKAGLIHPHTSHFCTFGRDCQGRYDPVPLPAHSGENTRIVNANAIQC